MELGCVPEGEGVSWQIDMTPVDFAAQAMVHVAVEQPTKSLGHVRILASLSFFQLHLGAALWSSISAAMCHIYVFVFQF